MQSKAIIPNNEGGAWPKVGHAPLSLLRPADVIITTVKYNGGYNYIAQKSRHVHKGQNWLFCCWLLVAISSPSNLLPCC